MTANAELAADRPGLILTRSRRKRRLSLLYSPENVASGISLRSASMSSSETRIRRPFPRPSNGRAVLAGQAMTMLSPIPLWFFWIRRWSPSPKATSSATDTVPQVMPKRVRSVRTFW